MQKDAEKQSYPSELAQLVSRSKAFAAIVERRLEEPSRDAIAAGGSFRVVKIAEVPVQLWVVLGEEGDYVVIRKAFCSCPHFRMKIATGRSETPCYHLVSVEIAVRDGRFRDLSRVINPREAAQVIFEVLAADRSPTLRRVIHQE
jgi:predicted nucleic acid-binding Zn finger protein